jgi:ribonuclease R
MEKRLPSRDAIVNFVQDHDHAVHAREIAKHFAVQETSYDALLRMLDHIAFEGALNAGDDDQYASLKIKSAPRAVVKPAAIESIKSKGEKKGFPQKNTRDAVRGGASGGHDRNADRDRAGKGREKSREGRDRTREGNREAAREVMRDPNVKLPAKKESPKLGPNQREGTLTVNARGFGFVSSVGATGDDVFVAAENMMGAMHGDRVIVSTRARTSRGFEGEIERILDRGMKRVSGILRRRGKSAWLEPDDSRVRGPIALTADVDSKEGEGNSGADGDVAIVAITYFPHEPNETPIGKLEAVLGKPGELRVEVQKTLMMAQIDEVHSQDAFAEAEAYGATVPLEMLEGREDLTHLPLPTIDPEDARDHDDAVWVERVEGGGYRAWIAIADVSTYVRPGTKLDDESRTRGCSVYLPDRAIPMLPRPLSSNLCSLLPDVVRLCLCVDAKIDADGNTISRRMVRGFMKSQAKLTYGGVARALGFTELPPIDPKAEAMKADLAVAAELSNILRAKRMKRGALDFELPEPKIVLDAKGEPIDSQKRTSDPGMKKAYSLIEELMLLANETVAEWLVEKQLPTIFRVHAPPDEKKLIKFATMAETLGIEFDMEETRDPKKLSVLLKRIADHPLAHVLNMLLLRSMKQATYDITNVGHFGLASKAYLHFTSPIRRYPDLVVHRSVHAAVQGQYIDKSEDAVEKMAEAALMASTSERRVMEVEREVVDLYRAVLMRSKIGERFDGLVTAVVGSGIFVLLDSPFVDVLVKLEDIGGDQYEVDDDQMRVVGKRSGDSIALGDRILIEVIDVGIQRRSVYGRRIRPGVADDDQPRERRPDQPKQVWTAHVKGANPRGANGPRGRGKVETRDAKKTDREIDKKRGKFERKAGKKKMQTKGKKRR